MAVSTARVQHRTLKPNQVQFQLSLRMGEQRWTLWRTEQQFSDLSAELQRADIEPESSPSNPMQLAMYPEMSSGPVRRLYPGCCSLAIPPLPAGRPAWKDTEVRLASHPSTEPATVQAAIEDRIGVLEEWLRGLVRVHSLPVLQFLGVTEQFCEAEHNFVEMVEQRME